MNGDKFDYVYDRGHWLRPRQENERLTFGEIAAAALELFALAVCLLAVIILFLCG